METQRKCDLIIYKVYCGVRFYISNGLIIYKIAWFETHRSLEFLKP
jgi:hypothetical protein